MSFSSIWIPALAAPPTNNFQISLPNTMSISAAVSGTTIWFCGLSGMSLENAHASTAKQILILGWKLVIDVPWLSGISSFGSGKLGTFSWSWRVLEMTRLMTLRRQPLWNAWRYGSSSCASNVEFQWWYSRWGSGQMNFLDVLVEIFFYQFAFWVSLLRTECIWMP